MKKQFREMKREEGKIPGGDGVGKRDFFRRKIGEARGAMDEARRLLAEKFGFAEFREGQEAVVDALLAERNALAVFPTGGGKSLCYQLPALLLEGVTLVISPLIALMKEQVATLEARGISAARWDSTLTEAEVDEVREKWANGELQLLYVSPERIANESFRDLLKKHGVSMIAIDEAHCISEWGHNFRPDYLKLAKLARGLKNARVLALTATATPAVVADIRKNFRIAKADAVTLDFHRQNLDLRITPCGVVEKKALLLDRLARVAGAAIVYVTRQETAEEVATFLNRAGVAARAYHAGLPQEFRDDAQRAFMVGETRVVVATIAFGMGIDKRDIRSVLHYNLPKSLENYVQEIGRAGRDGAPAVCEMLACGADLIALENFIHADAPAPRAIGNLVDRVLRLDDDIDVSVYDLAMSSDIRTTVVETLLTYLETAGVMEARGTFYGTYRARLLRNWETAMAGRSGAERKFLTAIWQSGVEKRTWRWFAVVEIAGHLGVKRERVVAALGDLEAAGDLVLERSGVRRLYRLKARAKPAELAAELARRFAAREKADLARLAMVPGLAGRKGCLTDALTSYFGQPLDEPCGHCDRCRGVTPFVVERPTARRISDEEWAQINALKIEGHAALGTPRQLARFLCGMTSPAAAKARLSRHDAFGLLADVPFAEVFGLLENS